MYRYTLVASVVLVIQLCATFHVSQAASFADRNHRDNPKRTGSPSRFDLDLADFELSSGGENVENAFNDDPEEDGDDAAKNRLRLLNVLRVKSLLSSLRGGTTLPIAKDVLAEEDKEGRGTARFSTEGLRKNSRDPYNRRHRSQIRKSEQYGRVPSSEVKRGEGPSLSIVGPLEVLRQSKLWDSARRRYVANQERIRNNERILADKGKRSVPDDYTY